jgi:hypothetical protein
MYTEFVFVLSIFSVAIFFGNLSSANFAVLSGLCDTAVLPELKQYRKGSKEPQGTQRNTSFTCI